MLNLKTVFTALLANNKTETPTNEQPILEPVFSNFDDKGQDTSTAFESKLLTYYKATYVLYSKLEQSNKELLSQKYCDYIDIQALRKDILKHTRKN